MEMISRAFAPPAGSFFLFGPRGTGKSTWLKQSFPKALYLDLLDPVEHRTYLAAPERLIQLVDGNPKARTIIIDDPQARACLLYGGRDRLMVEGVPCLPCEQFLRGLSPNQALTPVAD